MGSVKRFGDAPQGCRNSGCAGALEPPTRHERWVLSANRSESAMNDNRIPTGALGAILGALIVVALGIFLLSGGEHVGKKTVNSDADLPPIAAGEGKKKKANPGQPGGRGR